MSASAIAATIALIASVGVWIESLEIVMDFDDTRDLYGGKAVLPYQGSLIKRASILMWADGRINAFFLLWSVVATGSAYALIEGSPLAIVMTGLVIIGHYLKAQWMPRGGSGAGMMQRFVWISLLLFSVAQGWLGQTAALAFIALQGFLSYVVAGLAKLRFDVWQDGTAVGQVMTTDRFGVPWLAEALPLGWVSPFATWSTLVFEIAAPLLIFLGPNAALLFCGMAFCFHLSIAVVSGFTLFVPAFCATYPAIYWTATQIHVM